VLVGLLYLDRFQVNILFWPLFSKALFVSLEGKGGEGLEKKEGVSGRNRGHWKEGLWGVCFSSKYKTLLI